MKQFKTKYGYFANSGKEYVITSVKTPKPWVNVISNGIYGMVISQAGGGFSWHTHSEFNRLNRWHQDLIQDNWGKYFYFRNNKTGEVWSPLWMPIKKDITGYECRYGTGYATFKSTYKKIEVTADIFIPEGETFEVWNFTVNNKSNSILDLSVFTYFEWCLGSSSDFHREFHKTFIETEFDTNQNAMVGTKRLWEIPLGDRGHWNIEYPYWGFISSNRKIFEFEGDKETFIGNYGSISEPVGLKNISLKNTSGKWNDSVAVIKTSLKVKPGKENHVAVYMGIIEKKSEVKRKIARYTTQEQINNARTTVIQKWEKLLSPLEIETPDEAMNIMVNTWLRYQAIAGRLLGRTAYYQQSGAFGFRDQLQDSLVYLPIQPELTAAQIKLHAAHQFSDGTVLHWWHPISETGLPTNMTDDLLWLPYIVMHYITETGDSSILDAMEPFYDKPELKATLFEHCTLAIEKVLTRLSDRGLTLIGAGDWNDGLSAVGLEMKGESVWLTEFFYLILKDFSKAANDFGAEALAIKYFAAANNLKTAFTSYTWDGEWYIRGTKDSGEKFGSKSCKDGKIFLNPQSWAVISNIGEPDKQKKSMKSVAKHLLKQNGALLLAPAYRTPDKYIGYLSRYAPGRRENGGVYTHAATWAIWAFALLKDQKNCWEAYFRLSPVYSGIDAEKYVAEPYVTPGNIDGPDSPNYGMGGWTWYTGSASWYQKVIVDYILGVRSVEGGLMIDPCIPSDWDHYTVKRRYRGTDYTIEVKNPNHLTGGVHSMMVNDKIVEGNIIYPSTDKKVLIKILLTKK